MTPQTKTITLKTISALFIFLFVYTAFSKFFEFNTFRIVLSKSPFIGTTAPVLAWLLPIAELITASLLFFKSTQRTGWYVALSLMIVFTFYILYMLLFVPDLPCSCGGVLKQMSWQQHFLFNLFFTALAWFAIKMGKEQRVVQSRLYFKHNESNTNSLLQ